ncbi:EpsG family protein [Tepidiphilus sp. B18-69]|uniref:EpsG family protein n=2 Tax=Tepidiphilus baoligensis TaxID=2698687 RepID=A0ABX1QQX6_9PROT|nr:EpsG family protein [Tepidiphilus baoligensis]
MWPYWLLYGVGLLLIPVRVLDRRAQLVVWSLVIAVFSVVIGLRHEVGADWGNYLDYFESAAVTPFSEYVTPGRDPGYYLINWVVNRLGGSIYVVNALCGLLFMSGVVAFVRRQPLPWLALLVAVPYLIIVVGMGYTRQSVAIGLSMIAMVALLDRKWGRFFFWMVLAASFHKTALFLLPVVAWVADRNRLMVLTGGAISFVLAGYFFLFGSLDHFMTTYVEGEMDSKGAFVRTGMNFLASIIYFIHAKRIDHVPTERKFWGLMAFFSMISFPLSFFASTATDRMALYLFPFQIHVLSFCPLLFRQNDIRGAFAFLVIGFFAVVLGVWMFFAEHSFAWVPYRLAGFE